MINYGLVLLMFVSVNGVIARSDEIIEWEVNVMKTCAKSTSLDLSITYLVQPEFILAQFSVDKFIYCILRLRRQMLGLVSKRTGVAIPKDQLPFGWICVVGHMLRNCRGFY